jgi:hypothetical protein
MAQLIRTSINLTANGAALSAPSGSQTVTIPTSGNNTFTQPNGLLQSPNWPSSYANSANGFTVFTGISGVSRSITGTVNAEAGYDYVRVYDGSGTSGTLLYTVSGLGQNFSFTSAPGQTFTVRFTSDVSDTAAGFSLTVTGAYTIPEGSIVYRSPGTTVDVPATVAIPSAAPPTGINYFRAAGGTEALSGTLTSPSYPSNYPSNCAGYTVFPGLTGITRTLSGTVNTEAGFDFVRVYEGIGTGGKMLYQVTGASQAFSFTSAAGQTFTVQFTSDVSNTAAGFSLTVTGERVGTYMSYDSGPSSPYIIGEDGEPSRGYSSTTATTYTSSGTWNNPLYNGQNISMVLVFLLGAGGSGAAGPDSTTSPTAHARGGAGGGASIMIYPAIALGPSYPITVGAGGSTTYSGDGTSGGTTSFGRLPGPTDALTGGSGWFGTLYAGGGSGGTQAIGGADLPGGNGMYMGSASSTSSTYLASLWYSGPAGGRGGGSGGIAHPGGAAGFGFSGVATFAPAINGGAIGADGTLYGARGGDGTNPVSTGIMRAGSAGGGGGKATSAFGFGGEGGNGGRGAGGGGGGSQPGGVPGRGGEGGAGYAVIVSW